VFNVHGSPSCCLKLIEAAESLAVNSKARSIRNEKSLKHAANSSLREAVGTFLSDQKAMQKKYRGFVERQFLIWADSRKMKFWSRATLPS
jgi:hypothetical protein